MFPRIDLFLACALGVLMIVMYWVPAKTPFWLIVMLTIAFGLCFYIVWTFPWIKESLGRRLAVLFFVAACLCLFGDYVWPSSSKVTIQESTPVVFEPFAAIYNTYKPRLGGPLAQAVKCPGVHYAVHEKAVVVWFRIFRRFYLLGQENSKWTEQNDPEVDLDPKWSNDRWLRKNFHMPKDLPKNLGPPWSGIAKLWDKYPKKWSWIGWREWQCDLGDSVYYQKFEHGIIMGSFPTHPDSDKAILYILTDDKRWEAQESTMEPPKCNILEGMK